jgi:hypothetical protein
MVTTANIAFNSEYPSSLFARRNFTDAYPLDFATFADIAASASPAHRAALLSPSQRHD